MAVTADAAAPPQDHPAGLSGRSTKAAPSVCESLFGVLDPRKRQQLLVDELMCPIQRGGRQLQPGECAPQHAGHGLTVLGRRLCDRHLDAEPGAVGRDLGVSGAVTLLGPDEVMDVGGPRGAALA